MSTHRLTLGEVSTATIVVLVSIEGGHGFCSRLAALGFTPGTPIRVIQNRGRGPMIVSVRDARIALGRGEARRIMVSAGNAES